MTRPCGDNSIPILALVGAEILSLMAFVGVCEARAKEVALCESRWALALPAIALAGQSAATYFMDSGRGHGPGTGSGNSAPAQAMRTGTMRWLLDLAIAFLALGVLEAVVKPLARGFVQRRILAVAPVLFRQLDPLLPVLLQRCQLEADRVALGELRLQMA